MGVYPACSNLLFSVRDVQKGASSKAEGPSASGAYTAVRERDDGPRTPLGPFFNIPYSDSVTGAIGSLGSTSSIESES